MLSFVPSSSLAVLDVLRPCFTGPSFATVTALVTGILGSPGARTVTGMWAAAGLAEGSHWSRAHRFFSRAVWELDQVGLALARAVVAAFVPVGGAVTVAVDDTLFHRYGRRVHGAKYQHDGSAKGRDAIGRGNNFVILGIVVAVPFLARQICLPVLFRLHIPHDKRTGRGGTDSKTVQARALVDLLAAALPDHPIHVVGDALYRGPAWKNLPARVTFTTRLACNAVLYGPEPPRTGKRGHPAWKGDRLGNATEIASVATTRWRRTTVTRYGETEEVDMAVIACLRWGSLHRTPLRLVLVRDLDETRPYTIALITTDLAAAGEAIVARYASRWPIEQSIKDGKDLLGAGDPQSRLPKAVERTTPFVLANLTILVLWYHQAGHADHDLNSRRRSAPWYRQKRYVSVTDMIIAFRRARITDSTAAHSRSGLFHPDHVTCDAIAA
ncbi:transposase [Sphaerimonospora cavernae]|uniref:Transposase n=1 Tax=Sphaerimonospora cavernae TaxID=1740611 RepID=A0ABV6U8W9_9ACTN